MYISIINNRYPVKKMPTWKHTGKEVSKAKAEESLKSIKGACFGCGTHNADCSIAKAAGEISEMMSCETMSAREQIHAQISGALKGAKFPIKTPKDLIAAFPMGAETTCQVRGPEDDRPAKQETSQGIGFPVQKRKGCCRCYCRAGRTLILIKNHPE